MTYALAWKSESEAFLAADTALTSAPDPKTQNITQSSFGQDHVVNEEGKKVEERVVKLFLKKNIGVVFAGNYSTALEIIGSFYEEIDRGKNPTDSLNEALFKNVIPSGKTVQLAIAYYDQGPKILSFNANHDFQIKEEERIQIGNPLPIHRKLSEDWFKDINSKINGRPSLNLTAFLGVFQSYNLFSPQMERGIGGAFCGLYIDKSGGRWQPDILFIEYGGDAEKLVSTCFRHDCLVVSSPVIGQSRCLVSFLPSQTQAFLLGQAKKAVEKGKKLYKSAEFEYIVILGVKSVTVTVIEMRRNLKHVFIWLAHYVDRGRNRDGLKIAMFPKLKEIILNPESKLTVIDYIKSDVKEIPEEKILRKHISYDL